jgi:CsoR family transcriptional regulator, copper-sensing transcriptional repressor
MSLCGTGQDKERIVKRLHRIEGQIRGLCSMVENDRNCIDVLGQIASVSGALRGVWLQIVGDHLNGCIQNASLNDGNREQLINELMDNLKKIQ